MWPGFAPQRIATIESSIAELALEHADRWPTTRPFRLLEAMRALCSDITVQLVLGIVAPARRAALAEAVRRMLNMPGNPPLPLPGGDNGPGGVAGRAGEAIFAWRAEPVRRVLLEELRARRSTGRRTDDLIDAMSDSNPPIADSAIVGQLLIVLMAAQEPPAIALANVIYELAGRPGVVDGSWRCPEPAERSSRRCYACARRPPPPCVS